jgi:hypothetical protein
MHLGRRIAVSFVAAALCVSGCTSRAPEVTEPSRTATGTVRPQPATPTPSPTAEPATPSEPPTPPAELARTDEVGAAAAATYFLELYAYTMQTGDVTAWDALSWEQCEFCRSTRDQAVGMASRGETFTGGEIEPQSTTVMPRDDLIGGFPVDVVVQEAPSEHRASDGEVLNRSSGTPGTLRVDTLRAADGWKVLAVVARQA